MVPSGPFARMRPLPNGSTSSTTRSPSDFLVDRACRISRLPISFQSPAASLPMTKVPSSPRIIVDAASQDLFSRDQLPTIAWRNSGAAPEGGGGKDGHGDGIGAVSAGLSATSGPPSPPNKALPE